MSVDLLVALLSGVGAALSSGVALRLLRRHGEEECAKRMQAFRDGIREGRDR